MIVFNGVDWVCIGFDVDEVYVVFIGVKFVCVLENICDCFVISYIRNVCVEIVIECKSFVFGVDFWCENCCGCNV